MPTVLRIGRYRFFFFSNEGKEPPHIHAKAGKDEAKFWLDPVGLEANYGVNDRELTSIAQIVDEYRDQLLEPGMSTSASSRRSYRPTTALAKSVQFDDTTMQVTFLDGRILSVPLIWFPALHSATPEQRANYEIAGGGISLHWSDLDEDLSIAGLLAGGDARST